MSTDESRKASDRRTFLKVGVGVLGTGVAAMVGVPTAAYFLYPLDHATTSGTGDFLPAGPLSLFPNQTPVRIDLFADKTDAWNRIEQVKVGSCWVLNEGGSLKAFSTVCPHLGCSIDYDAGANKFTCPCHKSSFGMDGAVEDGPSPRSLDTLEVKAEEELVSIKYLRFRLGVDRKEPV